MTTPDRDLDRASARLAALGDELAGSHDAARRRQPGAVGRAREEQPDGLVARDLDVAVGAGRGSDLERAPESPFTRCSTSTVR